MCAVRRSVVSLAQPGRTWRNVLGSNGLPKAERPMGTTACQQSSDLLKALMGMRCSTRMIWERRHCLKSNLQMVTGPPIGRTLETDVTLCSGMNRRPRQLPECERYPTRIDKEMNGLPTSCSDVRQRRTAGWPTAGDRQGHGVLIVVVGVTSHQGGQESWPQGKGAQVITTDTPSRAKC